MASLFTEGKFQGLDASGAPLAGGKLYTYFAGTLTNKATYTTQAGTVANANPVILDSSGRAAVWLVPGAYRMVLKDAEEVTIWDTDNIVGGGLVDVVSVRAFGAIGGGETSDDAAFEEWVAHLNANGGVGDLGTGVYLVTAGVIDITRDGVSIIGASKGNAANLTPSADAPAKLIITGAGAGVRIRGQSVELRGFRISSDATRAALSFDIDSPGVRIEPNDTATARADRSTLLDLRIDKQPGDGVLSVGPAIYFDHRKIDVYECKGFGFRYDPGSYTGLVRTNKGYPGLGVNDSCRVGYCGGHAIAASNPSVTVQAQMAIRMGIRNLDSFGNGQNTAIMYGAADGNYYDFWIFGENCNIESSAPCGRVGLSLTPELIGGIWIAGRDHRVVNNRFIDTKQPIYWGHISAQPSTGLTVDTMRIVNATLTHAAAVKVQSASSTGLRITYDRVESFTDVATRRVGSDFVDSHITYRGTQHHVSALTNTGATVTLADDSVYTIPISGMGATLTAQGVLVVTPTDVFNGGGMFHVRLAASSPKATKWAGESNTVAYASGGALAGTTGTDTTLNISCDNTNVYIENRLGFSITFTYQLLSFPRGFQIGV